MNKLDINTQTQCSKKGINNMQPKHTPTQRPWRISDKSKDAIICIGEPEQGNTDYYGGFLIAESVNQANGLQ